MVSCCVNCKFGSETIYAVFCKIAEDHMEKSGYCLGYIHRDIKPIKIEVEKWNVARVQTVKNYLKGTIICKNCEKEGKKDE